MATLMIPFPDDPHSSIEVELEGKSYELELRYNERDGGWRMSIASAEKPLLYGRRVHEGWPLLAHHKANAALPPGEFIALTPGTATAAPELVYIESSDLPA